MDFLPHKLNQWSWFPMFDVFLSLLLQSAGKCHKHLVMAPPLSSLGYCCPMMPLSPQNLQCESSLVPHLCKFRTNPHSWNTSSTAFAFSPFSFKCHTSSWIMCLLSLVPAFPHFWKWEVPRPRLPVHGIPVMPCSFSMLSACVTESATHLHPLSLCTSFLLCTLPT